MVLNKGMEAFLKKFDFFGFCAISRRKILKFVFFYEKLAQNQKKSKFWKKPPQIYSKSLKDYLVQISANLNQNCDLRYNLRG